VGEWTRGLVGEGEGRGHRRCSAKVQMCKGGKVKASGLVVGWAGGQVGEEEARGSGKVQRCKGGKVNVSGLVVGWTGGRGVKTRLRPLGRAIDVFSAG